MPKHHFIPAAFIAGFSANPARRRRKSTVFVLRNGQIRPQTAENLAVERDLYTLHDLKVAGPTAAELHPQLIDSLWTATEQRLPLAISALDATDLSLAGMDGLLWVGGITAFVAQLFVRDQEFRERYLQRLDYHFGDRNQLAWATTNDQTNLARWPELVRVHWGTITSRWHILQNRTRIPFITNDVGYVPAISPFGKGHTFYVPLSKTVAAFVEPLGDPPWFHLVQSWHVRGLHVLVCDDARGIIPLNGLMVASARREVYGPSVAILTQSAQARPKEQHPRGGEPHGLLRLDVGQSQQRLFDLVTQLGNTSWPSGTELYVLGDRLIANVPDGPSTSL